MNDYIIIQRQVPLSFDTDTFWTGEQWSGNIDEAKVYGTYGSVFAAVMEIPKDQFTGYLKPVLFHAYLDLRKGIFT